MKNFIHITRPTGHVFEIPTSVVANNRAAAMLAAHPDEFADLAAALADTTELFAEDSWNIKDCAANNMNWADLQANAKLVRFLPQQDSDWHEGDWTFQDAPALLGDLDGEQIMNQPVELVMHTMAATQQLCNVTVLNGDDGQPYGAFALIIGNGQVVGSYIQAMQMVGDHLTRAQTGGDAATAPVTH